MTNETRKLKRAQTIDHHLRFVRAATGRPANLCRRADSFQYYTDYNILLYTPNRPLYNIIIM